jgi:hypothetical protein
MGGLGANRRWIFSLYFSHGPLALLLFAATLAVVFVAG